MTNYSIDLVIPWLDGNDPEWREEKNRYSPRTNTDDRDIRYREWDTLRYWFRGVEKYAPWLNRVFFVTWGHLPEWLDVSHPKLRIVRHEEYIPEEYRPAFNSIVIENSLHLIPDLSEHFILINDDIFLVNETVPEDFFRDGKPVGTAVMNPVTAPDDTFRAILSNDMRLINRNFDRKKVVKESPGSFLNPRYGMLNLRTLLCLPWTEFVGFYVPHLTVPLLKSTMETVWEREFDALDRSSREKFRSRICINDFVFAFWDFCTGNFAPGKPLGRSVRILDDVGKACRLIGTSKDKVICLNDSSSSAGEFKTAKEKILRAMEKKFPERSSFELY